MKKKEYLTIDGIPVEIGDEKNLLELIRKIGIDLPTFCYHSELSIYGACRMCMVENQWGGIEAACSTPPKAGMEIQTNTKRLRKYRKMILELLLSNHCRDCTTCHNNGKCKLQELAMRFDIDRVRFPNTAEKSAVDESSKCISKDKHKCILCGDCVRVCSEVQNVGAIDFAFRGSKMMVSTAFDAPIAESNCIGCGQCAAVCPTGAIVVKNDVKKVWNALDDDQITVVAQVAPAVRAAIGKQLGLADNDNAMGRIVAALRRIGFDKVFDTSTGADLTVIEEANEFKERLEKGEKLPLFTSCCPAWINYCEKNYPELLPQVSTCRSPMQMFASVIKEHYRGLKTRVVHVAVMPCTAKKFEAARTEFTESGVPLVDYVITTQELIQMIGEAGIVFSEVEPEAVDMPFGTFSGAGVIFGVSGGVTEAVLRCINDDKSAGALRAIAFNGVRGMEGLKETSVMYGDREVKIAMVSGMKNADRLIGCIKSGEAHYDFVEVMACPGGCVSGAGQPATEREEAARRGKSLYAAAKLCHIKRSEENPLILYLYEGLLKGREHELLHVKYGANKS